MRRYRWHVQPTEHAFVYPTITELILEKLKDFGEAAISSFFPAQYPEARLWRRILGLENGYQFKRETFMAVLARLRRHGLVERSGSLRGALWRLTARGRRELAARGRRSELSARDGVRRLVIFDIPERERKKRDVIRVELAAAGFVQLQKSVWYGERPLPTAFLELVEALDLRSYVHVFSIREAGTIPNTIRRS